MAMVVAMTMLIPVVLVAAVLLAVYGDFQRKRNKWTDLGPRDSYS